MDGLWTGVQRCLAGAGLVAGMLLAGPGCTRSRVTDPLALTVGEGDVNAELDFWEAIGERPVISNDEGFHGMLLFVDGEDPATSYTQRLEAVRARGWVDEGWSEAPDLAMQRGTMARAVVVYCEIEGGVMMQTLGPVARYATRELQYMGLMGAGSEQQALSGREFMGVLGRAQDYMLLEEARRRLEAERLAKGQPPPLPSNDTPPGPAQPGPTGVPGKKTIMP